MRTREEVRRILEKRPKPLLKICGLMEERDATCLEGADLAGFVFAESKRKVSAAQAGAIRAALPGDVLGTGVFVNEETSRVISIMEEAGLDIAQLHGDETEDEIRDLQAEGIFVIKAFKVRGPFETLRGSIERSSADLVLLDAPEPGSGKPFSWKSIRLERDYLLAGGLHAGNLRMAENVKPYGFDLSSGAETGGVKDREKMREIITIAEKIKRERIHA